MDQEGQCSGVPITSYKTMALLEHTVTVLADVSGILKTKATRH